MPCDFRPGVDDEVFDRLDRFEGDPDEEDDEDDLPELYSQAYLDSQVKAAREAERAAIVTAMRSDARRQVLGCQWQFHLERIADMIEAEVFEEIDAAACERSKVVTPVIPVPAPRIPATECNRNTPKCTACKKPLVVIAGRWGCDDVTCENYGEMPTREEVESRR